MFSFMDLLSALGDVNQLALFSLLFFLMSGSFYSYVILGARKEIEDKKKAAAFTEKQLSEGYFSLLHADTLVAKKSYDDEMSIYDKTPVEMGMQSRYSFELDELVTLDGEIPDHLIKKDVRNG